MTHKMTRLNKFVGSSKTTAECYCIAYKGEKRQWALGEDGIFRLIPDVPAADCECILGKDYNKNQVVQRIIFSGDNDGTMKLFAYKNPEGRYVLQTSVIKKHVFYNVLFSRDKIKNIYASYMQASDLPRKQLEAFLTFRKVFKKAINFGFIRDFLLEPDSAAKMCKIQIIDDPSYYYYLD